MKKNIYYYFLKPPNWYCWLPRLEKMSSPPTPPVGGDVNPDLPRPEPIPMACPMENEVWGPFSLSSDPSLNPPTMPTSARFIFLAASRVQMTTIKRGGNIKN